MATLKEQKAALRKKMGQLTHSLSESYFTTKDLKLTEILLNHNSLLSANVVLSYWSMPKEAATHTLNKVLLKLGKTVLLPVIDGNVLLLRKFTGPENMVPEPKYGILEPQGNTFIDFESIDIALVPGVAFTKNGKRCGHGKGYYDGLLPKLPNAKTLGLAYEFQIVADLPANEHDVRLNEVIFA